MSDLISRQAAIDDIWTVSPLARLDRKWIDRWLRQLPPAEPKRGKWIGKYPVSSICSECGYLINDSKVKVFAFCPNCGADMRQKGENSESN